MTRHSEHDSVMLDEAGHQDHHPSVRTYVTIGIILAVITAVEVAIYNIPAAQTYLAFMLLVLSAVKFLLVVSFFMHLRFDNKIFASMFGFGLFVAFSVISAVLLLFRINPGAPNAG